MNRYDWAASVLIVCTLLAWTAAFSYSRGLEYMMHTTEQAIENATYSAALLERCTMTQARTLSLVLRRDAYLHHEIQALPPIVAYGVTP